ncbi:hypothetical protein A3D07_00070 [Candidatus Curtissbacteria bacterium RIFCSPHIGHO2_02_FULL_42_15]|uniref:Uncharacterized protein n=1 Tax=Candidatus Curtissbacteria bacterium RIFCSPHIGHO2_02_FULL_42_15 TaxID=1797716 RepID=A0A1F5GD68_9BACT|nr:MAG: hypothetical protein A3D07_00070 [Candidatus Curtissbacteria bacterium RIFCSPHIGHO2_02_FULL_42_15]
MTIIQFLTILKILIAVGISYLIVRIFLKKFQGKLLKQLIMSLAIYLLIGVVLTTYAYLKVHSASVFDYLLRWPDMLLWIWFI